MSKYKMVLDEKRCIHCKACEIHCKVRNNNPVGIKFATHFSEGPFLKDGKIVLQATFRSCYHCDEPPCVADCPVNAMIRRESDGIVYVDQELCIGCECCTKVCPWNVPQLFKELDVVGKCDLCMERLDAGLQPACVTACTTHALKLVRIE